MHPPLHPCRLRHVAFAVAVILSGCAASTTSGEAAGADAGQVDTQSDGSSGPGVECVTDGDCVTHFGDLPACVVAVCDADTNTCNQADAPGGTSCDDGDTCTQGDVCLAGACLAGAMVSCEDTNPCTLDTCDSAIGCVHTFNDAPCDDDDACTVEDVCSEGACTSGTAAVCDDGNPCTDDACDVLLGCLYPSKPGAVCDDLDACTVGDQCSATGVCVGQGELDCEDGNLCTNDTCSTSAGCVYEDNAELCDDGDSCTSNDACALGVCTGALDLCDDDDPCTDDTCTAEAGCVHLAHQAACDDGDPCTMGDSCSDGTCQGIDVVCEDDNACTVDFCHPTFGCQTTPLVGSQCDDGDACTTFDACTQSGACLPGGDLDCDDGSACTADSCDVSTGCVNIPLDVACDDEDACTLSDTCTNGACVGSPAICEDDNPCTNDQCDPSQGCIYPFNTGNCDDDDPCTVNDICVSGACVGLSNTCDDGKPCTTDICDETATCQHTTFVGLCDDDNACTIGDSCVNEECISGPLATCDDDDPCTIDLCDPDDGCSHTMVPSCLPPAAWPIINEFDYEQFGDDTSDFIELLVVGEQTVELDVYTLELISGTTGQPYATFALSDAADQLHPGERLVVGSVATIGPLIGVVATIEASGDFLDNGGVDGDAIRLVRATPAGPVAVDAVSYEHPVPGANEGETHVGFDGQFGAGDTSFARCPEGLDTDVNSFDFTLMLPDPGAPNSCEEIEE